MIPRVLGLLCLAAASASADTLPQAIADKFGAKCLNGQPPPYELQLNESSTKWVLFLEGGGWCYGLDSNSTMSSCAGRAGGVWPPKAPARGWGEAAAPTSLGSGAGADIGGVMSQDCSLNPDFCTWNKLFMHYCDGASFGGGRTEPIAISTHAGAPAQMWMRGRNNFNAIISYFLTNSSLGMAKATDVILSGGSAGGLAVFYNLDHLATLLPKTTRLVGFPDAGFFIDAKREGQGDNNYRNQFIGADPVWNVTGSGGTNLACLAANKGAEWKCLMAQYIAPHLKTPIFVMNSNYDAWQMGNVLAAECIPTPTKICTAAQNTSLRAFRDEFVAAIAGITSKKQNGCFLDSCYVHEQNVNYCSSQGMPNCVGWSPAEPGSKKWGYTTAVTLPNGKSVTPQEAFGAWYKGESIVAIDPHTFFDNPTCHYLGKPAAAL